MGMMSHSVVLTIVLKNGTISETEFYFDNEESAMLSKKANLFRNMNTTAEFREHFLAGFKTQYDDLDFEELITDLGDIDAYEDSMEEVESYQVEDLSVIILLTDLECDGYREYSWEKYVLQPYKVTRGSTRTKWNREKNKHTPSVSEYIRNTILQPGDIPPVKKERHPVSSPKTPNLTALTFAEFGKDFEYSIRERDITIFDRTFPRGIIIQGYKGNQKSITIPEAVESFPVIHIASMGQNQYVENVIFNEEKITFSEDAFKGCPQLAKCDSEGNLVLYGVLLECQNITKTMILPASAKKIGFKLFEDNELIEEVFISEGTEIIDSFAFANCKHLHTVHFPSTLKTIDTAAFEGCECLTTINFPKHLQVIGSNAFQKCKSLTSVSFPESLSIIKENAFNGCKKLNSIQIHPNTECETGAFSDCGDGLMGQDGLTVVNGILFDFDYHLHRKYLNTPDDEMYVIIPETVMQINGSSCFDSPGTIIDSFTVTNKTTYINSDDFYISGIESFRIVDHTTGELLFETDAFASCTSVLAFSERFERFCELTGSHDYAALTKQFGKKKRKSSKTKTATTPAPQKTAGEKTAAVESKEPPSTSVQQPESEYTAWMHKYETYVEKNPAIVIDNKLFVFSGLPSITHNEKDHPIVQKVIAQGGQYRSKVSGITDYLVVDPCMAGKSKIESAIEQQRKGKGIKIILLQDLEQALKSPTPASSVKTPKTEKKAKTTNTSHGTVDVKTIQKVSVDVEKRLSYKECNIGHNNRLLTYNGPDRNIVLPEGIIEIADFAFDQSAVTRVVCPSTLKKIGKFAFSNCGSLKEIVIQEGLEEIDHCAFQDCSTLQSIFLPSTLQKVAFSAFSNCPQLSSVVIQGQNPKLDRSLFSECLQLKHVTLPDSLQVITKHMFFSCSSLTEIKLPSKLNCIEEDAFSFCENLRRIIFPVTVTKIESKAFQYCQALHDIHIPPFVKNIGIDAFKNISEDAVFHVLKGSYAEQYCRENGFTYDYNLDAEIMKILHAIVLSRKQKRAEAQQAAEKLQKRKARYQELTNAIAQQQEIISQNKGWFGEQAKARKAAQQTLNELQYKLRTEFPSGKP